MVFGSPHGQVLGSCHNYGVYESLIVSSPGKTHRCKPPVVQVLATNFGDKLRWFSPARRGRWAKMAAVHITPLKQWNFRDLDPRVKG